MNRRWPRERPPATSLLPPDLYAAAVTETVKLISMAARVAGGTI